MSYQLLPALVPFLQEGNKAVVITGDVKQGKVVLRLTNGVEYRAELPKEFAKTLSETAFTTGTKWTFDGEGNYQSNDAPPPTPSKKGRGTGSNHKQQIGA